VRHSTSPLVKFASTPAVAGFRPAGAALAIAAAFLTPTLARAQATGLQAIHGSASQATQGNKTVITTQNGAGTGHSVLNWQSFSVPSGSITQFNQPSANSTAINRVLGNNPSAIFGTLSSNGRLVLVNPSGIAVGAGAVVDTAGFTASVLRMSEADAIAGRLIFGGDSLSNSQLSANGQILARSGDIVLIAPDLQTGPQALLEAPNGATVLAAGQKVDITGRGLEGIRLQMQAPTDQAVNLGTLKGDAVGVFAATLKHSGLIQANAVSTEGGKVVLKAKDSLEIGGSVKATQGQLGGQIHATANKVKLKSGAVIDVSGAQGGGEALIGGGWQGQDSRITNARETTAEAGSTVKADATEAGNGGTVVLWSDDVTRTAAAISARGGTQAGNGGKVETSGKGHLVFRSTVDTSAPAGQVGDVLLDPQDIIIANGGTAANDGLLPSITTGVSLGVDVTISEQALEALTGNVTLQASRDVIVNDLADNQLNLNGVGFGSTLSVTAGRHIVMSDANDRIRTNGGAVTLTTVAGQIEIGGVVSNRGNVVLTAAGGGGNLTVRQINTRSTSGFAGNISLSSSGSTSMGTAAPSPGAMDIDAGGNVAPGNVSITSGGPIVLQNGNTIIANDLQMSAVGGIYSPTAPSPAPGVGQMAFQAARVQATNSGTGSLQLASTSPNGATVADISALGYGLRNLAAGEQVSLSVNQGMLNVTGPISSNGSEVRLSADRMAINASVNTGSNTAGQVNITPWAHANAVHLGSTADTTAATLELSGTELAQMTTGMIRIGSSGHSGGITIKDSLTIAPAAAGGLSLINKGNISQDTGKTLTVSKLNADASDPGNVSGGSVNLGEANNSIGMLAGRAGRSGAGSSFTVLSNVPLQVGAVDTNAGVLLGTGGNITIETTGLLSLPNDVNASATGTVEPDGRSAVNLGPGAVRCLAGRGASLLAGPRGCSGLWAQGSCERPDGCCCGIWFDMEPL
jgi:filamentous hemagglutinin family protein